MKELNCKKICGVVVIVFVLSLIPMLILSFYNHPAIDDFYYGIKTYHAYQETGSVIETIKAAGEQIQKTYGDWQGTFSAIFLFALHPAIFGDNLYFLSTFILLAFFIGSTLLLSGVILKKYMKVSTPVYLILTLTTLFLCIQFAPDPCQAFFWWNGSVFYTLFYSFAQLMFACLLLFYGSDKTWKKAVYLTLSAILAGIIGGGNFVTGLFCALLLLTAVLFLAVVKKDRRAIGVAVVLVLFLISFGISLAAPGNAVRKAEQPNAPNAPMAILESFYFSLRYISRFSTITVLFVLSLLCPFIYRIASKLKFSFKYPFAFLFFSFCFFTAQFTPPVWGYSTPGSGRIFNIYFFSYFWFVLSNIFYFCGYISKKKKFNIDAVFAHLKKPRTLACASVLLVIMLAIPLTLDLNDWDTWDRKKFTSVNAVYSLVTGDAQQYDREYKERLAVYHDDSVQQVEFQPFTKTPPLLFYGDMTQDADFQWSNKPLREYYDKEYVIVIWN